GAAASDAHAALPTEGHVAGRGVRLFEVVREPVVVVLHAGVTFLLPVTRPADDLRRAVAVLELEGGRVLGEVVVRLRAAGVDHGDFQARLREPLRRPAAGGAGAYYKRVERAFQFTHEASSSCMSF